MDKLLDRKYKGQIKSINLLLGSDKRFVEFVEVMAYSAYSRKKQICVLWILFIVNEGLLKLLKIELRIFIPVWIWINW